MQKTVLLGQSLRQPLRPKRRSSASDVCSPSRAISPRRSRTSFTPCGSRGLPPLRMSSIRKTRTWGRVRKVSRAHFSTKCGGHITSAQKGLTALCASMLPRAIRVLPAPHSAMTLALGPDCQRLLIPMTARACAGYGLRSICESNGEGDSSGRCKAGYDAMIRLPISSECARR